MEEFEADWMAGGRASDVVAKSPATERELVVVVPAVPSVL